jgi:hypothetical protein
MRSNWQRRADGHPYVGRGVMEKIDHQRSKSQASIPSTNRHYSPHPRIERQEGGREGKTKSHKAEERQARHARRELLTSLGISILRNYQRNFPTCVLSEWRAILVIGTCGGQAHLEGSEYPFYGTIHIYLLLAFLTRVLSNGAPLW